MSWDCFYIPTPNLLHPLKTIFSPNFPPEHWGCSSEEESSGSKVLMSGSLCQRRLTVGNRCWGRCGIVGASPESGRRKLGFRRLSGKEGEVFGIGSSRRRTPNSSGSFARVHSAARLERVRNRLGSVNSRSSTWWLIWSARHLGLAARYHYNISIPWFLALPKPFLPLVLLSEVSMVPNHQRQIGSKVYFDK